MISILTFFRSPVHQIPYFRIDALFDRGANVLNDCGAGRDRFQTAVISARAEQAIFIDGDMPETRRRFHRCRDRVFRPKKYPAPIPIPTSIYMKLLSTLAQAEGFLRRGGGAHAVFKQAGNFEFLLKEIFQGHVLPFRHLSPGADNRAPCRPRCR